MFTTKKDMKVEEEITNSSNLIGKGTIIEGNIEASGNVRIEGQINGDILSKSKVALGVTSYVNGNLIAQYADVEGEVKGKLEISEVLVLKSSSKINGDICTKKLVVEAGALISGNCSVGGAAVESANSKENGKATHKLKIEGPAV